MTQCTFIHDEILLCIDGKWYRTFKNDTTFYHAYSFKPVCDDAHIQKVYKIFLHARNMLGK